LKINSSGFKTKFVSNDALFRGKIHGLIEARHELTTSRRTGGSTQPLFCLARLLLADSRVSTAHQEPRGALPSMETSILKTLLISLAALLALTFGAEAGVVGKASYYNLGGRTASGGHVGAYTAAHRTLPFGSRVRVTNLRNNRSVVVTINDRGPFTGGRVIDVSAHAAESLGFRSAGVAMVRVDPMN
jgi:rare lipoprotein A